MKTPLPLMPEMMFRAAAVVPPTVLSLAPAVIHTPMPDTSPGSSGNRPSPVMSVPIRLPSMRLPEEVPESKISPWVWLPVPLLPEIRFPAPAAVPPMVTSEMPP